MVIILIMEAKEFLQFVNCWRDSDLPIHFSRYSDDD